MEIVQHNLLFGDVNRTDRSKQMERDRKKCLFSFFNFTGKHPMTKDFDGIPAVQRHQPQQAIAVNPIAKLKR